MKTLLIALALLLPLATLPARAEIVKSSVPCQSGNCLYWWPQSPSPAGWQQDRAASEANGINVQIPAGATFTAAETVIYAKALYKPLVPTLTSLARLIASDKKDFLARDPELLVSQAAALATGDGRRLESFTFSPGAKGGGNWEQVAYGEEGDFFLIFTVSSQTRSGLAGAQPAYRQFVGGYREKP